MKPWEIAVKLIPSASDNPVSVELASDTEFQSWIESSGLSELVDDAGIAEWSFDDRCRIVNFALRRGYALKFVEAPNNSETIPETELFGANKPASEVNE